MAVPESISSRLNTVVTHSDDNSGDSPKLGSTLSTVAFAGRMTVKDDSKPEASVQDASMDEPHRKSLLDRDKPVVIALEPSTSTKIDTRKGTGDVSNNLLLIENTSSPIRHITDKLNTDSTEECKSPLLAQNALILDQGAIEKIKSETMKHHRHQPASDTFDLTPFIEVLSNKFKNLQTDNTRQNSDLILKKMHSGHFDDLIRHLAEQYSIDEHSLKIESCASNLANRTGQLHFTDRSWREAFATINPALIIVAVIALVFTVGSAVLDILQGNPSNLYFQRSGSVGVAATLILGYLSVFKDKAIREAYKAVIDDIDNKLHKKEELSLHYAIEKFSEVEEHHLAANKSISRKELAVLGAAIFFTLVWGYGDKAIS